MTHPAYLLLGLIAGFALGYLVGWDQTDRWHERQLRRDPGYREDFETDADDRAENEKFWKARSQKSTTLH